MWRRAIFSRRRGIRWLYTAAAPPRLPPVDEGDWAYSSEWWGTESKGHVVFSSRSDVGNGVVSVVAYSSSRPGPEHWAAAERWLQERYAKIHPEFQNDGKFKLLGYQWRVLQFNGNTRQSTAKVMAAYRRPESSWLYLMQQPHCLAVPYLKSMVSAGFTALASSGYDLPGAVAGKNDMNILCIGHGGGSLPLYLASKIKGATVHIIEIDPAVISASIEAMGFPSSSFKESSDQFSSSQPADADQILWEDINGRLFLHRAEAEDFVLNSSNVYDLIFIDAYDGDDIFPRKFWDPHSPFLEALAARLHPVHGTTVVNLHSDSDILAHDSILPMGKYVSQVAKAYKEHIGFAFTVSVPWLCNSTLVACNGVGFGLQGPLFNRDFVLNTLISKSNLVEFVLDLPFPCLQYIKNGFVLVD